MVATTETRTIEQLPRTTVAEGGDLLVIQSPGGPLQGIPLSRLIGRLGPVDVIKATRANLYADLAWNAGSLAIVWSDPEPTKLGYYVKSGASGAGTWNQSDVFRGTKGQAILSGEGPPSPDLGDTRDYYLDMGGPTVYGPKAAGGWPAAGILLKGAASTEPGPAGPAGAAAHEFALNFTTDAVVYIPAAEAMTLGLGNAAIGTGQLAFAKSTAASPNVFNATGLPAALQAGAWLRVTATNVVGFLAAHLRKTA